MKFEDMTIRQLISECEKMQKQLKAFENRISTMNTISEHIKILGRQNKKLKRDNERYRKLLDRNPNKENLSDWKPKIIRIEVRINGFYCVWSMLLVYIIGFAIIKNMSIIYNQKKKEVSSNDK